MGGVKLIKMKRGGEQKPFSADVHPDEVKNYQAYGWELAGEAKKEKPQTGGSKAKPPAPPADAETGGK